MVVIKISTVLMTIDRYLWTRDRPKFSTSSPGENPMAKFIAAAKRFVREDEGATLVEYALAIALISLVAGAGALILGTGISDFFGKVSTKVNSYAP
jgi:pilus assembly protein Flp/PilA